MREISLKEQRKAKFASLIGATIEYYDYFLYGVLASIVFSKLFFPSFDPTVGLLLSLASFGVPYFMRPIGSVIFGHIGDKQGRKKSLIITLILMGVATIGIGVLPDYSSIGVWAPILLVILRLIQGFAVGGEWGGAVLVSSEYSDDNNKSYGASIALVGASLGMLLGTLTVSLLTLMPNEQFMSWGWRLPFIGSVILIVFGFWLRSDLKETPEFEKTKNNNEVVKTPIVTTFKYHWKNVLLAAIAKGLEGSPFYIFATFVIVFATEYHHMNESYVLFAISCGTLASVIFIPIWAKMADRLSAKFMFQVAAVVLILFAFPYFILLTLQSVLWLFVAVIASWIVYAISGGTLGGLFIELFDTKVRMTGISTGYQIGAAVFGGLTPLIAVALLEWFDSWVPVALFMIVIALLSLISTTMMRPHGEPNLENVDNTELGIK